jgi:uncharacterized protein (DUF58 family)
MAKASPFPLISPLEGAALRRLRLKLRKTAPTSSLGAHLHRRMGQSLEFREYRDYNFGEDIRTVDWAASARQGQKWDLVAKSFEVEERRTLIVLLDCRYAMRLPETVPKLGVAAWIAQALFTAALEEHDRVIVMPVFSGATPARPITIEGEKGLSAVQTFVADVLAKPLKQEDWNTIPPAGLSPLRAMLKPSAAVVMITDGLFDDPKSEFASFARLAQKNFRTFHMVEIDSWPHERAQLQAKPFRLQGNGVGGNAFGDQLCEADATYLNEVETQLSMRRADIRHRSSGPGLIWPKEAMRYPADAEFNRASAQQWFRNALSEAPFLASLLSRAG